MPDTAELVSCSVCRWQNRDRNEYAHGGCLVRGMQDRFWETGMQVRCGLFNGITIGRMKQVDAMKRGKALAEQETLF